MAEKMKFSVAIKTDAYKNLINNTLGDPEVARRFVAEISTVVSQNKQLQLCDAGSIISAGLLAQTLNLSLAPSLGFAYVVPYKDKAQFQIGYKGLVQLAQRSGQFQDLDSKPVRAGEYKGRNKITGQPIIEFDEMEDLKKPIVGYLAYFILNNGFTKTLFMTKEAVEQHAKKYSRAFASDWSGNLWKDQFDMMAQKTVLKLLLNRYAPLSIEMQQAVRADQAVVSEDLKRFEYVDNEKPSNSTVANTLAPEPEEPVQADPDGVIADDEDPI